jgi:hypothetical protein
VDRFALSHFLLPETFIILIATTFHFLETPRSFDIGPIRWKDMKHIVANISSRACRTGTIEQANRSNETALLLDSLIVSFDATNEHLHYPEYVTGGKPRVAETVFSRFLDLPAEIRDSTFPPTICGQTIRRGSAQGRSDAWCCRTTSSTSSWTAQWLSFQFNEFSHQSAGYLRQLPLSSHCSAFPCLS